MEKRMSFIKLTSAGYWYIDSKIDPRWNANGYGNVGGCCMPPACAAAIKNNEKMYGEQPEDLEWGYEKF
jgi:hypothetical protein